MNLRDYEGKYVKLVDSNGNIFTGKAEDYIFPEDNEPVGIESITLYDCPQRSYPVEFYAPDIKSIEIIEKN